MAANALEGIWPLLWGDSTYGKRRHLKNDLYFKNLTAYLNRMRQYMRTTPGGPIQVQEIAAVRLKGPTTWWWPNVKKGWHVLVK
ncbi:MAG: hypothetical protein LBP92_15295 [Deltaproteobacteria bacterium]|nr:hypothetical protein [Deltaproteobacteria bacterium]